MNKTIEKSSKKATKKAAPRKFETLTIHTSKPVILTDKVGTPKLHFVVER